MLIPLLILLADIPPGIAPGSHVVKHYNKRTGAPYWEVTGGDPNAQVGTKRAQYPDWNGRCRDSVHDVETAMRSTKVHYSDGSTVNLAAIPCVGGNGHVFTVSK